MLFFKTLTSPSGYLKSQKDFGYFLLRLFDHQYLSILLHTRHYLISDSRAMLGQEPLMLSLIDLKNWLMALSSRLTRVQHLVRHLSLKKVFLLQVYKYALFIHLHCILRLLASPHIVEVLLHPIYQIVTTFFCRERLFFL